MANNRTYQKGYYELKYPHKYKGMSKPYFKSSYEQRMMYWLDVNNKVLEWSYEPSYIEYLNHVPTNSPDWMRDLVDFKVHKYYVDFYAKLVDNDNNVVTYILEIKPFIQTQIPKEPKKKTKKSIQKFYNEMKEYIKNANKWEAAEKYAHQKGYKFAVLTENELF